MPLDTPLVLTCAGPVLGRLDRGVHSWRGVPYAAAERFAPARRAPAWTAARDATDPGPVAPQHLPDGTPTGTEDCLTLDVYAPADAPGPLPVLVFVHGGAFVTGGAADYDGTVLARRGPAVVVTVNYRLGPLGFLQLGTAGEPEPSCAVTDLLAALDWVHREVGAFGGDPDRLTLVGQSAGASLVCALLATAAGRRARAAVALSIGGPPVDPADAVDVAGRVLAELGLARTDRDALRAVPVHAVLDAARRVARTSGRVGGAVFAPVLDGTVLAERPEDVAAAGALRDTVLWLGSCRDEMAGFLRGGTGVPTRVARQRVGAERFEELLGVYSATAAPGEDPLQALLTDEMWARPAERLAAAQAAAGGRAWLSRFDHAPSLPPFDVLGPAHGADNACLWADPPCFLERPLLQRPGGAMSDADVAVTRLLQDAVLGVVAGGTPAAGALAPWPPYGVADRWTAVLDAVPRVLRDPGADRWRAWEEG